MGTFQDQTCAAMSCHHCKHALRVDEPNAAVPLHTVVCALPGPKLGKNWKIIWEVCDKWEEKER